ncbi:MAG: hypothetical protein OIF57_03865 [Marinobacterium sp.]|nr:hypothetical protein [Marinobacterium sp.]
MGTRIRIDQSLLDDQNYWEETQQDAEPRRKTARRNRRREIEERMENNRLRRHIADSYQGYDHYDA